MPRVVGEDGRVAGAEVERSGGGVADEDGGLGGAFVEVEPFFGLFLYTRQFMLPIEGKEGLCIGIWTEGKIKTLTFGCQCSSLKAPGFSVTKVAAIVLLIGKLVESILRNSPPVPPIFSGGCCSVR